MVRSGSIPKCERQVASGAESWPSCRNLRDRNSSKSRKAEFLAGLDEELRQFAKGKLIPHEEVKAQFMSRSQSLLLRVTISQLRQKFSSRFHEEESVSTVRKFPFLELSPMTYFLASLHFIPKPASWMVAVRCRGSRRKEHRGFDILSYAPESVQRNEGSDGRRTV